MIKQVKNVCIFSLLIMFSVVVLFGGPQSGMAGDDTPEDSDKQIANSESHPQKQDFALLEQKVESRIRQASQLAGKEFAAMGDGWSMVPGNLSTPLLKMDETGNIQVTVIVENPGTQNYEQLRNAGMKIDIILPEYDIVEGWLPYNRVETVAGFDFVKRIRTPGYPIQNAGDVNSEGDAVLHADDVRAGFGVDGSGFKIGVISDGVDYISNSIATGDLPLGVEVVQSGSGNEGTAMLEIIHDLAPGAELAFYGPETSADMVVGIQALEAAGCEIIVDDVGFFDEPKFEDGPIAQEARQFFQNGGVYVSACGNSAQEHYIHQYVRMIGPGGNYQYVHDYGSGDNGNLITISQWEGIIFIMQWNNEWGQSGDNFDAHLRQCSDGTILANSTEIQSGSGDPWERFEWINMTGHEVQAEIKVMEYNLVSPPASLMIDYHVFYLPSTLEYSMPQDSVFGHAAVEEVLSTAAADAATVGMLEGFSSRGPATIYFPTEQVRQVPNITGVDGVQTHTGEAGYFDNPFYGTSAAAPHLAAIASLIWEIDPSLTSGEVSDAITSTAIGMGGWDAGWGFGRVNAMSAAEYVSSGRLLVSTDFATSVGMSTATINGNLDSLGQSISVDVSFDYGTHTGSYPFSIIASESPMNDIGPFHADITGLDEGTTYYFRARAADSDIVYGTERSFTTKYGGSHHHMVAAGERHTVGLRSDGKVLAVGNNLAGQCNVAGWENIQQVAAGEEHTVGLMNGGTPVAVGANDNGQCNVGSWTAIQQVAAGGNHTVGLEQDRTVLAVGANDDGQCNVESWTAIQQVAAGGNHTVGLEQDRTVLAVGANDDGQLNVETWSDIKQIAAGRNHTVGLTEEGSVLAVGANGDSQCNVESWTAIQQVAAGGNHTVGLKEDGSVLAVGANDAGQCNVESWTGIQQVAAGGNHTVGLKEDGTVLVTGNNEDGQCNIGSWVEIQQVTAGWKHTAGLKSDGTVAAVGDSWHGQCNVGTWTNIQQISAYWFQTIGLKKDGTVLATGRNNYGQCDVGSWATIQQVAAGGNHTVGLKEDGRVVAVGDKYEGKCDVGSWTDVQQIAAGYAHTLGLRENGTVLAKGWNEYRQCNVGTWTGIQQVSAGDMHTVGLRDNGTVVASGSNVYGQCNIETWVDIKQVSAAGNHTVGLKEDGTVVATGDNSDGQCNVESWTNIQQVAAGCVHTVGLKTNGMVVATGDCISGNCNFLNWNLGEFIPEVYLLTISSTDGGSVNEPGEGIYPYNASEVINLEAEAENGYIFTCWTGSGTPAIANPNAPVTTITMNGDYSVIANFEEEPWSPSNYDENQNDKIEYWEMVDALTDYVTGNIDYSQMIDVLTCYVVGYL